MRNPFNSDEARAVVLAVVGDDDVTPLDGPHPPRGRAQRGSIVIALDHVVGEYVGSDKPTPDPPDLAVRRPKWAGMYRIVESK